MNATAAAIVPVRPALPLSGRAAGLRVLRQIEAPGRVHFEPEPEHRIRIHTGAPVRGHCGQGRFVYTDGDVDLLPAGSADAWTGESPGASLLLRFPPTLLALTADDLGIGAGRAQLAPRHQFRDPQIQHLGLALEADRQAGHPGGALYTESLALALVTHLLARHGGATAPRLPHGLGPALLRRLTEYIDAHLDQDLSLARLARVAGLSASHLKTLFKRSTGLPVHAYVVRRRVERARDLLLHGDLPATQVALMAGFSHQSHMLRCMRRVLGEAALPPRRRRMPR